MTSEEKALGQRLQLARQQAGLTQQELCQKADLSYSTLAKIERGAIKSPSVFTVAAIAQATGTSVENLLGVKLAAAPVATAKQTSKSGVRFVYFDLDGVLLSHWQSTFSIIAAETHLNVDAIENAFWRHNDSACRGQMSLTQFNAAMAKDLGLKSFDWLKFYLQNAKIDAQAQGLLNWAAEHYEVGLLHNHIPGVYEALVERGLIPQVAYKAVVGSADVGYTKPDAKIYEIAAKKAGVKPGEILFIDDVRVNLTGADHAGWQIMLFDPMHPAESVAKAKKLLEF